MDEAGPLQDAPYWILRQDQLRALISPRRLDIVDRLAAGGPASIKELAASIGARPSALYHHMRQLLAVNLVEEAGSRVVNRKREQLYATPSRRMRLIKALADPANRDLLVDLVAALARQMERDFRGGIDAAGVVHDGPGRNLGFFRLIGSLGPEQMEAVNTRLTELLEIFWRSNPGDGPLVVLNWILAPVPAGGADAGDG